MRQKSKNLSKIQITEFSILFIILNYFHIASKRLEEISDIRFLSEKNENLKNIIVTSISSGFDDEKLNSKINLKFNEIIQEVNANSIIQIIIKNKEDKNILDLLDELIQDHKEQSNLKKIESLEQKLINNLDENSYSELIKLKSQLNRE